MIHEVKINFQEWLNWPTTLKMIDQLDYGYGETGGPHTPDSIKEGDILYTILSAAFCAGALSIQEKVEKL